ncbi:MAG: PaaI family thioesterase [Acidobacteriota bacterium]
MALPGHGPCFVCGKDAGSLGLTLSVGGDNHLVSTATFGAATQGPPGHVHGGCLAAVLDELMGACAWTNGHQVMAVHLDFDYRAPVPIGVPIAFEAWLDVVGERKVETRGKATLPDGRIATESHGVFARMPEHLVSQALQQISSAWSPAKS